MTSGFALRRAFVIISATVLAVIGVSLLASWHSSAGADPYPPSSGCVVTMSGSSGSGSTASGSGFASGSTVGLSIGGTSVGRVQAGRDGSFSQPVAVPAGSADPLVATSAGTSCSVGLLAGDPASTQRGTGTVSAQSVRATAYTGFQAITATVIALALVGGGLLLVTLGRRRRDQH